MMRRLPDGRAESGLIQTLSLRAAVCTTLLALTGPVQAQSPGQIIELPGWQDPHAWAAEHQLEGWRLVAQGAGRRFLITRMDARRWQALQAACTGEVRCYHDSCQQARRRTDVTTWLVAAPPPLPAALAGEPYPCEPLDSRRWQAQVEAQPQCWRQRLGTGCGAGLVSLQPSEDARVKLSRPGLAPEAAVSALQPEGSTAGLPLPSRSESPELLADQAQKGSRAPARQRPLRRKR